MSSADGTRHYLGSGQSSQTNTYQTSDGSHITYVGSATNGGTVYYNDGTRKTISVVNNRLLPTQITDPNGNYLQIVYRSSADGYHPLAIHQVTDTLGRLIQFKYNVNKDLIAIDVPPFGQTPATRVQFDYQDKQMKYNFSGLTVENISFNDNLRTLRHIYFPTSGTGCLLSYSDYGMVYEFSMRRQMSFSGGAITDGVESGHGKLNYPFYTSGQLTDAPSFASRSESPGGTYSYSTSTDSVAQTMTFTVSQPDSSQLLLTRSTDSSAVANGRLVQAEIKSGTTSYNKQVYTYANDPGGSPQVQSVTSSQSA